MRSEESHLPRNSSRNGTRRRFHKLRSTKTICDATETTGFATMPENASAVGGARRRFRPMAER